MAKNGETALTTIDNPFSPFSQFSDWYSYDLGKGYDCCTYLARMVGIDTIDLDSDVENELIEGAINDIVRIDPTGVYVKVKKVDPKQNENGKDFKVVEV